MSFLVRKVRRDGYQNTINSLIDNKEKKVLLYGAGIAFQEFINEFPEFLKFNIVAISDQKFTSKGKFKGMVSIPPSEIANFDFDLIIVTNERFEPILKFLKTELNIQKEIKPFVKENSAEERQFINYLDGLNFEKTLEKLSKKLKDKKIMLYGAGSFIQVIKDYYDISKLNIVGIADKKIETDKEMKEFLGYKTYAPSEIIGVNPDYVVVSTLKFVNIIDFLSCELLKDTKIKVIPLVKLPFIKLVKEIWNS